MKPLRICIDARLPPGGFGGSEMYVLGLARGLLSLKDSDEQYVFLAAAKSADWVRTHISHDAELLMVPLGAEPGGAKHKLKQSLRRTFPVLAEKLRMRPVMPWDRIDQPPRDDGTVKRAGCDVMHFTMSGAFLADMPSVYQPHDLQHLHLPHMFSPLERAAREVQYSALCRHATAVAVVSSWVKQDLINHYHLPPEKVRVIPYAPVLTEYPNPSPADLAAARVKFKLPETFVFYPAQTFRHKNHLTLIDALARLRDQGLVVPFVSSGKCNDFYAFIDKRVRALGMSDQVQFLGFVSPLELQCLWRLARAAVIPTMFEAASFPVWEAFLAGVPVASSNVTSLPQQVGDSGLLFDPASPDQIAAAVKRLWTDADLRHTLIDRGRENVARFSWDRTARTFRALYRRLAGRILTEEDESLLSAAPIL